MIFLAVGTQFGFDRLVKAVDEAIGQQSIQDKVFAQIGPGGYLPKRMEYVVSLEKDEFDKVINSCNAMISHAGMGNIALAMKLQKPLLVMPRLKRYGEVVNDHQVGTAKKFEELGHILVAWNEGQLAEKVNALKDFVPKPRVAQPKAVASRIIQFLNDLEN